MAQPSSLYDQANSFGWISIALHWITAIAIVALWYLGKSILWQSDDGIEARRSLHITLGLIAWLPLVARILWRLRAPHPHAIGQSPLIHKLAQITHFLILTALAIMIISGPLMAWALSNSAMNDRIDIANIALLFHSTAATALLILVAVHILGALKHLMFHADETIARIFLPRRND